MTDGVVVAGGVSLFLTVVVDLKKARISLHLTDVDDSGLQNGTVNKSLTNQKKEHPWTT